MKEKILIFSIIALIVTNFISLNALNNMSSRASYHMQQEDKVHQALESIMDRIHEDNPDYYLDVLTETDAYMLYQEVTKFN